MKRAEIPLLGYALLGLLYLKPASGYDLMKIFSNTPMGSFSDSPGAIYPALRRLEDDALIAGEVEEGSGMRRRRRFHLTPAGHSALNTWLSSPVGPEQVTNRLNELMLKFAFLDDILGEASTLEFLRSFERELRTHCSQLRGFFDANKSKMPRSAMLALKSGVFGYEAQLQWTIEAVAIYEEGQVK
jgi:DNA-binding PadR family transcriptional regulator